MSPETCPNCGAEIPPKARACPECGACAETGWSEEAATGGLDLPDDSFNYGEFVKQEFGPRKILPRGIGWGWWMVALVVVVALLWLVLG